MTDALHWKNVVATAKAESAESGRRRSRRDGLEPAWATFAIYIFRRSRVPPRKHGGRKTVPSRRGPPAFRVSSLGSYAARRFEKFALPFLSMPSRTKPRLPEALSRNLANATLRALRGSYDEFNASLFGSQLKAPTFSLIASRSELGRWDPSLRAIEISEPMLLEQGWAAAIEVLKHEMAHQFVHEALGRGDAPAHGALFQQVCQERGIDGRAAGVVTTSTAEHPALERIRKLLSLAQSSNEHEAQSATRVAQRLMLRHNIDQLSTERGDGYTSRQLGRTTGRTSEAERILGTLLQDHFFVDVIWVYGFRPQDGIHGRAMEVCGRQENVELAHYVYDFVSATAERLWKQHRAEAKLTGNADRRAYVAGVMTGFRDQLNRQKESQVESGLIWLGDPGLSAYFERRHPSVSRRNYYERSSGPAREHGRRAGRAIVLHRGVGSSPSGGVAGQLGAGRVDR